MPGRALFNACGTRVGGADPLLLSALVPPPRQLSSLAATRALGDALGGPQCIGTSRTLT